MYLHRSSNNEIKQYPSVKFRISGRRKKGRGEKINSRKTRGKKGMKNINTRSPIHPSYDHFTIMSKIHKSMMLKLKANNTIDACPKRHSQSKDFSS